jgi:hypothetical protein
LTGKGIAKAMERLEECYTVRGRGGFEACLVIQERLQNYGLCSYTRPDPEPPKWRFFFETNLKPENTKELLGTYMDRYQIDVNTAC